MVGTTLINLLNYKESTKYRTFEINEEMFISGFIVETEDKSNLVINEIKYNNEKNEFQNTNIEDVKIRVLRNDEVIFEDNESLIYLGTIKDYYKKSNILICNASDLYDSNIAINIYITYYDGLIRTLSYNL